jgi:hypothetical protein
VAYIAATAPSCGTPSIAMWSELKPEYDVPSMPTLPVLHGCVATHSMAARRSRRSTSGYSSGEMPVDKPVPRTSTRRTAKLPSLAKRW